ncbi:transglycosylase SLT domain-containing protein [Glaesserella sp.]|uniref:transglycosylase SLT domain-containing protein n=1 Tax=Glaesserella sp. TaxID=2094731 RepID=UPI0035A1C059
MLWKKTMIALLLSSSLAWASTEKRPIQKVWAEADVVQLKQAWAAEQVHRYKQRENFVQLESLLQSALQEKKLSMNTLTLANQLMASLTDYPLKEEAELALLNAKISLNQLSNEELAQFIARYPDAAKRQQLAQLPFDRYYQQQKFEELMAYAKTTRPTSIENQCRLFAAQFQLLSEQSQPNPEAEQAGNVPSPALLQLDQLVQQFDQFWQRTEDKTNSLGFSSENVVADYWKTNATLPSECAALEAYWRDKGLKTKEKVRQKIVGLFHLGGKRAIEHLIANNQDASLTEWLTAVQKLLDDPTYLQIFAQNQPLDPQNKALMLMSFPQFIRRLPEQMSNPDFSVYQQWAEQWRLSPTEVREWKTVFLNRFFDNTGAVFQVWRDQQIRELKIDSLTERRLRMAIWQKTDLTEWLSLLSAEGKAKAEWRYWSAKVEPTKREALLNQLSQERGFYPMLAASQLNKPYQVKLPEVKKLTDQQKQRFQSTLDRITELRHLKRFDAAKIAWVEFIKPLTFEEKLALSDYATQQNWYDLAVEGTIQAKAWDYISLRLPNAYDEWFDMALSNKTITKSFAMAIARQESAWNFQAVSHANAVGLMQMLSTTAAQTAKYGELPFSGRNDLLNPFRNIMLGTTHLAELNAKYPDNRILIACAYNAGSHRVVKWLERAGGKLEMDEFIASIPFLETRGYVQNVLTYDYYYQVLQGNKTLQMFYPTEQRRY